MPSYAVVGATSWGLTLAALLHRNGHNVTVLARHDAEAEAVRRQRGIARLPELRLPDAIHLATLAQPGPSPDGIVIAVPAQSLRETLARAAALPRSLPILSGAKGLEHGTRLRMSQVIAACGWPSDRVAALSGPNLAHEIARGLPAASVIASTCDDTAAAWQQALSGPTFRCYRSSDIIGTELGGALKNVIAIAAGAAAGLELGANAVAAIMTRGLAEMTRLGASLGAEPLTFQGLAGVGDLAVTCYSPLSRNRRLGELLARGIPPAQALAAIGEAVEGAATAPVALDLASAAGVDVPITRQVAAVLAGHASVQEAMSRLLSRALRPEMEPHLR